MINKCLQTHSKGPETLKAFFVCFVSTLNDMKSKDPNLIPKLHSMLHHIRLYRRPYSTILQVAAHCVSITRSCHLTESTAGPFHNSKLCVRCRVELLLPVC